MESVETFFMVDIQHILYCRALLRVELRIRYVLVMHGILRYILYILHIYTHIYYYSQKR